MLRIDLLSVSAKHALPKSLCSSRRCPWASLVSLPSPAEAPVPKPGEKPIWVLGSPPDQDGSIDEAVVIDSFFGEGDTP